MYSIVCKFGSLTSYLGDWVYLNRTAVDIKYVLNRSSLQAGHRSPLKFNIEASFNCSYSWLLQFCELSLPVPYCGGILGSEGLSLSVICTPHAQGGEAFLSL